MIRMRIFAPAILCCLLSVAGIARAQESSFPILAPEEPLLEAVISGPEDIAVGRTVVLDASRSRTQADTVQYRWYLEGQEQPISESVEAVYTPDAPGTLSFALDMSVTLPSGALLEDRVLHTVTVYRRKIVLVADASVPAQKIEAYRQSAQEAGVFLRVLQQPSAPSPIGAEEALAQMIAEQPDAMAGAGVIVVWSEGITGLQSLMRAFQSNPDLLAGVQNQSIVTVTERSLQTLARIARGPFSVLQPQRILLTRSEALYPLLTEPSVESFVGVLAQRDVEYLQIDASSAGLRPWNMLSGLVNAMITRGVPSQTVILLLVLPVIAMILTFLKQVIGITTFGLYTPSIIALSFLALGWQIGVLFLLFIIVTGYATRALMRRWRLLYIPKMAIILTVVSLTLLFLMGISAFLGITFSRETIFILLIMSTLAESFLNLKSEQGWSSALTGIFETIAAALLCVFIVQWDVFQSLVLAYPELILLTILADVFLGRWPGLRLLEYVRFRAVFQHMQEE